MPDVIHVTPNVLIPAAALTLRAVRASGPGGQNVNKVASKVELRVDLALVTGLAPDARARLEALTASRRDAVGRLLVTSQRTRDQHRNLEDAREKVRELVARALRRPRARRPTAPSKGARERRLATKRHAAQKKKARRANED
jgi:ribosome-associated protein